MMDNLIRITAAAVLAVCSGCSIEHQPPDTPLQPSHGATIISTYSPTRGVRGSTVGMGPSASLRLDNETSSRVLVNLGKHDEIPAQGTIAITPHDGGEPLVMTEVNQALLDLPVGAFYIDVASDSDEPMLGTISVENVGEGTEHTWSHVTSAVWIRTVGAALEKEACSRVLDDLEAQGRVCIRGADSDAPTDMNCWARALASCEGP